MSCYIVVGMTGYSTPPQPAPPPLGGWHDEDQPVRDEKWWNRDWFRWVVAITIMAALWLMMDLLT